ncbi:MAG TPA: TonB-dependent receptor [Candidatus Acidoferrales bacterium]|jgi:hypothetical protein|nr:TonB-dependent receptor [Candidatus Acidoferrales bacterium]
MSSQVAGKRLRRCAAFLICTLGVAGTFAPRRVSGQATGATLSGTVTDSAGAVVPNANVSVKNTATGIARDTASDNAGLYSVPELLPGDYEVTTTAPGFSTQVQSGVRLAPAATVVLNVSLNVGEVTQKVEVTATAQAVELSTSSLGADVTDTSVRELPLNGRDWTQLATLQPGIIAIHTQASANTTANRGNRGFGNELSDSGHTPYQNNYRINGISVNDYTNGSPGSVLGVQLGVDGIQEFSVLSANYPAQYGRASGAEINAITRSGTNQFHGSAYWFLREKQLNARNYFDPATIPPFHRNQFGGAFGGPIKTEKTFFFVDYEGVRQDLSQSNHDIVPTAAARSGNLCSAPTTGSCTPNTVTVSPLVAPYLPFWPLPNAGLTPAGNGDTGYYSISGLTPLYENYVTAKVDHKASEKDNLSSSFMYDKSSLTSPDALVIGTSQSQTLRVMASADWTRVIDPSVVNTARIGYSLSQGLIADPGTAINPLAADASLGAVPGRNSPILSVTGLTVMQGALGALTATHQTQNSYQAYDDFFVTKGSHSFTFGGFVENIRLGDLNRQLGNGQFNFGSLQAFLTDQPTSFTVLDPAFLYEAAFRQTIFGAYAQDDWRARRNLTLNLGLRYEPTTRPSEGHGRFGVMQNLYSGPETVPVTNLWQSNTTLLDFEPRVGLSWDPWGAGKTAIRAAFGIYDVLPLAWTVAGAVAPNYPFGLTVAGGGLPAGSFPTGALSLVPFSPANAVGVYIQQHPGTSYTMDWNLNIQHQITSSLIATLGYVGSRSIRLSWKWQDQDMVLPTLTSAGYLWPCDKSFNPCTGHGTKLNTSVSGIAGNLFDGDGYYDGLQAGLRKVMGHGLQADLSYTWSKCIDTESNSIQTDTFLNSARDIPFFDKQARRGLCDYNISQNFVGNYIWEVPGTKSLGGVGDHVLTGWEVGGIITASTGSPFTLIMSGDSLGQRSSDAINFPDRLWGTPGCTNPVNTGGVNYLKLSCFTPPTAPASFAAECQPAAASVAAVIPNTCMNLFGDNGRNSIIGPGLFDFDLSLFKNNYITENVNVQFRAEFFNVLNHTNFQSPLDNKTIFTNTGTLVGGAGAIDATATTSRQIQLGLKVIF